MAYSDYVQQLICIPYYHTTILHYGTGLPKQLRQPDITFGQFKKLLKTFMFG